MQRNDKLTEEDGSYAEEVTGTENPERSIKRVYGSNIHILR